MLTKMFELALVEHGVTEIPGQSNNPRILSYAKTAGLEWVKDEDTSWCGIFMGYCAKTALLNVPENCAKARNWLKWGYEVEFPKIGDIVVLWRDDPKSWKGHVGLFVNRLGDEIHILGGNQGDKVCIEKFPVNRVLGYRAAAPR